MIDILDLTPNTQETPKIYRFSRLLSKAPFKDIVNQIQPIAYAGTNSTWPAIHQNRGVVRVNLLSGFGISHSQEDKLNVASFMFHGLSMAGNFGRTTSLTSQEYSCLQECTLPDTTQTTSIGSTFTSFLCLSSCQMFVLFLMYFKVLVMAFTAFLNINKDISAHAVLGLIVSILIIIAAATGYIASQIPSKKVPYLFQHSRLLWHTNGFD